MTSSYSRRKISNSFRLRAGQCNEKIQLSCLGQLRTSKQDIYIIEASGRLNPVLVGQLERLVGKLLLLGQLSSPIFPCSSKQTNRIVGTNRQVGQCYQLVNSVHSLLSACSFATQPRIRNQYLLGQQVKQGQQYMVVCFELFSVQNAYWFSRNSTLCGQYIGIKKEGQLRG